MFIEKLFGRKKFVSTITGISIKFLGETHTLPGLEIKNRKFDVSIPFQNKMGSSMLPDMLKVPPLTLEKIAVLPPFKLLGTEPSLPAKVDFMSKIIFKLKLEAPQSGYNGPLSVSFSNSSTDLITLSVNKVTVSSPSESVALDDSAFMLTVQKGQVFKKSMQLFKIYKFMDKVNLIEASKPFEIVNTVPQLPLTLDHKDSYIIDVYLKAPDFSYSGSLEIKFK